MKELGLKCIKFTRKMRKYNSYKGTVGKTAKNLLNRRFTTPFVLQKLVTDITDLNVKITRSFISIQFMTFIMVKSSRLV